MKCLLITSYFPPVVGGSATVYGNIFKYGQPHIKILTARTNRESGITVNRNAESNIHTVNLIEPAPKKPKSLIQSAWIFLTNDLPTHINVTLASIRIILRYDIKIVCIGEIIALGWLGTFLKYCTGVKVIYYAHGEELTTKQTSRFFGKKTSRHLKKAHGIVCVSRYTQSILINDYKIAPQKTKLITNGIDIGALNIYSKLTPPRNNLVFTLFSAGRLIDRKGFDYTIIAVSKVLKYGYDVRLLIAGDGPQYNRYEEMIKTNNLSKHIQLLGHVSDDKLMQLYQSCDCFIMPNRQLDNGDTEGFGLVFLEANFFQKPVIGGNAGGAVDAILHGKSGLLVDSKSTDKIAKAIIRIIDDEKLRKRLSEQGHQWAIQNDVQLKVQEFLSYCDSLTQQT